MQVSKSRIKNVECVTKLKQCN